VPDTHPGASPSVAAKASRRGALLLLGAGAAFILGCRPHPDSTEASVQTGIQFDPAPPTVGGHRLSITLTDDAGQPLRLGRLQIEANMHHAGMRPVFTELVETRPGHYTGTIEFTMAGDWFLLLSGQRADGGHFSRRIDLPGVTPK
jgi:hypothetical protein